MIEKHASSRDLVLDQIVREKLVKTERKKNNVTPLMNTLYCKTNINKSVMIVSKLIN